MADVVTTPTPDMKEQFENGRQPEEPTEEQFQAYMQRKQQAEMERRQAFLDDYNQLCQNHGLAFTLNCPKITINDTAVAIVITELNS